MTDYEKYQVQRAYERLYRQREKEKEEIQKEIDRLNDDGGQDHRKYRESKTPKYKLVTHTYVVEL